MVELNDSTVDKILKTLYPYKKGCEVTAGKREANMMQKLGAKKLAKELDKLIKEIEEQL